MVMIIQVLYYLLLGLLTDLLFECINDFISQENNTPPTFRTALERTVTIVLWPVMVGVFVFGFFKEMLK